MDTKKNTERLLSCVVQNMIDEAIEIIECGNFDTSIFQDIGFFGSPFPLSWVIFCNEILLENDNWDMNYYEKVIIPTRENCKKLKEYFEKNDLLQGSKVDFALFPNERGHLLCRGCLTTKVRQSLFYVPYQKNLGCIFHS